MPHYMRGRLVASAIGMRLNPGRLYAQILRRLERESLEQRRREGSFRARPHDDTFSIHPRTLADLKRRDHSTAG
jgi:hypothetical protein